MPALHFLGTGSACTDAWRTTTMLAFEHPGSVIVIDCGGDLVQRLQQALLPLDQISTLILTHEHPDHVAGFPLMMQKLWLGGRLDPLPVRGIAPALTQARKCFAAFDTSGWAGLPEVHWLEFPHAADTLVLEADPWRVTATPSLHGVPSVALRIEHLPTGGVCVYSSDTALSTDIARFAHGADILIHEASGSFPGHSTAIDAARIAATARVGALHLVHLPPEAELDSTHLATARQIFANTFKAVELGKIDYP